MDTNRNPKVYALSSTALVAAVLCVLSPWAISIGPIPLSLCTLVLYFSVYLLNWKRALAAVAVYVLLGAVGLPVFSNFGAGLGKLAGPTGGYIIGYFPMVVICALFVRHFPNNRWAHLGGMILGTAVLYALGTAWFCTQTETALAPALSLCVIPFLPGDGIKIVLALSMGPILSDRLAKAGLPHN